MKHVRWAGNWQRPKIPPPVLLCLPTASVTRDSRVPLVGSILIMSACLSCSRIAHTVTRCRLRTSTVFDVSFIVSPLKLWTVNSLGSHTDSEEGDAVAYHKTVIYFGRIV